MSGWLYQPFAATEEGELEGTASFAFTASGVLTGSGALVGSTAMAFSCSGTLIDRRRSLVLRPRSAVLAPLLHF